MKFGGALVSLDSIAWPFAFIAWIIVVTEAVKGVLMQMLLLHTLVILYFIPNIYIFMQLLYEMGRSGRKCTHSYGKKHDTKN